MPQTMVRWKMVSLWVANMPKFLRMDFLFSTTFYENFTGCFFLLKRHSKVYAESEVVFYWSWFSEKFFHSPFSYLTISHNKFYHSPFSDLTSSHDKFWPKEISNASSVLPIHISFFHSLLNKANILYLSLLWISFL